MEPGELTRGQRALRIAGQAPRAVWVFITRPWLGIFYLVWAAWSYYGFDSAVLAGASLLCWASFKMMWQSRTYSRLAKATSEKTEAQQEAIGHERARYMNRAKEAFNERDQIEEEAGKLRIELAVANSTLAKFGDSTPLSREGIASGLAVACERLVAVVAGMSDPERAERILDAVEGLRRLITDLEDDQAANRSMQKAIDETHAKIAGQLDEMVTQAEERIAKARVKAAKAEDTGA